MLTLVGLGVNDTFAYFRTLARTPPGEVALAGANDILRTEGAFDLQRWMAGKGSGMKITNQTHYKVWVYFQVDGSLREAIRPLDPIALEAGQTREIEFALADVGELGMLAWRNQGRVFTGEITAGVLNGFVRYRLGKVEIPAGLLFQKFVGLPVAEGNEITGLTKASDVSRIIAEKDALKQKVAEVTEENFRLRHLIKELNGLIDRLRDALRRAIRPPAENPPAKSEPVEKPPAETPPVESPPTGSTPSGSLPVEDQPVQEPPDGASPPDDPPGGTPPGIENGPGNNTGVGEDLTDNNQSTTGAVYAGG
ncbi:MAG: hypothetical protein AB1523_07045 [Bacillota bacterium]